MSSVNELLAVDRSNLCVTIANTLSISNEIKKSNFFGIDRKRILQWKQKSQKLRLKTYLVILMSKVIKINTFTLFKPHNMIKTP